MKISFRATLALLVLALAVTPATAQVIERGNSALTTANAIVPGCTDSDLTGPEASAACSGNGYLAASSATTSFASSTTGGNAATFGHASARSIGPPASQSASANASSIVTITWEMLSDTHYSMSTLLGGGATATFTGTGGALPSSGIVTPGFYTLRAEASAFALAQDSAGAVEVIVGPRSANTQISFASVGSPSLVRGTIAGGGAATAGLLVEAFDGETLLASTVTGDDGSFLLPNLPGTVILRVSDPGGEFATAISAPIAPPANFNLVLSPTSIPTLPAPFAGTALLAFLLAGSCALRRRRSDRLG